MNKIILLLILSTVSCDKNIGILFDVSGSMENSFDSLTNINSINKKSDELINILKNIAKNIPIKVFTILFGLSGDQDIIDFIELLKISNNYFKTLTAEKTNSTYFRRKLIKNGDTVNYYQKMVQDIVILKNMYFQRMDQMNYYLNFFVIY